VQEYQAANHFVKPTLWVAKLLTSSFCTSQQIPNLQTIAINENPNFLRIKTLRDSVLYSQFGNDKIHLPFLPPPFQALLSLDLALLVDRLQPGLSYYSENEQILWTYTYFYKILQYLESSSQKYSAYSSRMLCVGI
jgi:hypothetical protein